MPERNLPPDEQADHSGPIVDAGDLVGEDPPPDPPAPPGEHDEHGGDPAASRPAVPPPD